MPIFGPKPQVNPFGKVSIFGLFEVLVFIAQKGRFFVLEYRKRHFPDLYCLKRKVGKMVIFVPKRWINPFGKVSIFGLFQVLVFIAQKGFFFVQEYLKRHFPCLYWLKRKVGKMVIFGPKPRVNPFGIMSILQLFELLVFVAWNGVFLFQNIVKDIFLAYIA